MIGNCDCEDLNFKEVLKKITDFQKHLAFTKDIEVEQSLRGLFGAHDSPAKQAAISRCEMHTTTKLRLLEPADAVVETHSLVLDDCTLFTVEVLNNFTLRVIRA